MQRTPFTLRSIAALVVVGGGLFLPAVASHAQLIVTRQVSTGDISPTLFAQVRDGGPFEPPAGPPNFLNVQLFTPAVDDGTLAFTTSSMQSPEFDSTDTVNSAALYLIDDLVPQLYSDGSTNLNVKPIAHGVTDPVVGVVANLPVPDGTGLVNFDLAPNAISLSGGSVSVLSKQQTVNGLGLYEGTTTTTTTEPVPSLGVVVDQNTPVLPNTTVFRAAIFRSDGTTFARDGARTVSIAEMENGRLVMVSHEGGVRQNLLVSGTSPNAIGLPDGPFVRSEYLDADGGQIALISNDTNVYQLDAANNASLLVDSGGPVLNYIALDGGDVVVGKRGDVTNAFNPIVTSTERGGIIRPNTRLLGDGLEAIARVDNGALVDLVNQSTQFPDAGPAFEGFGPFSYSDGSLAFLGSSTDRGGLFVVYEGTLHKVLEIGDTLEGKPVLDVNINRHGLDGDTLGFVVTHEITQVDSARFLYDQSIYTMSLAENFALDGDFDLDGDVDGNDFLVWQRGGSPNGTGSGDLALWQDNFGAPLVAASAVPEPSSLALLGLSGLILLIGGTRSRPLTTARCWPATFSNSIVQQTRDCST